MVLRNVQKGREFERDVESLLRSLESSFPARTKVLPQQSVTLRDGRNKVIDFAFDYELISSHHMVAIECQHREAWTSEILDKILSIRNNSHRNRFWFVYHTDGFLSSDVRELLDNHGVLHFSFGEFERHLILVRADLEATENWLRVGA